MLLLLLLCYFLSLGLLCRVVVDHLNRVKGLDKRERLSRWPTTSWNAEWLIVLTLHHDLSSICRWQKRKPKRPSRAEQREREMGNTRSQPAGTGSSIQHSRQYLHHQCTFGFYFSFALGGFLFVCRLRSLFSLALENFSYFPVLTSQPCSVFLFLTLDKRTEGISGERK